MRKIDENVFTNEICFQKKYIYSLSFLQKQTLIMLSHTHLLVHSALPLQFISAS